MAQPPTIPTTMALQQVEMMQQQPSEPNNPYYPDGNDLSGGLPINLDSLRDGPPGSKPFYPYSTLIRYAIKGSPTGKLLLEDIYYAIESRFPYFRTAPAGWKNSVRHNLSLNPCFVKVARPLTDRGKGSYWTVDDNVDPRTGVHRVRNKKGKKGKDKDPDSADGSGAVDFEGTGDFDAAPRFEDQANFVAQQVETDGSAQPTFVPPNAYPPSTPFSYDPSYQMLGMRYPPMPLPLLTPEESLPVDEHGNIDWRMTWVNELAALQRHTAEQDKANVPADWYRSMFYRLRFGMMGPYNPEDIPPQATVTHAITQDHPDQTQE